MLFSSRTVIYTRSLKCVFSGCFASAFTARVERRLSIEISHSFPYDPKETGSKGEYFEPVSLASYGKE